jgi:hypothetical protein
MATTLHTTAKMAHSPTNNDERTRPEKQQQFIKQQLEQYHHQTATYFITPQLLKY